MGIMDSIKNKFYNSDAGRVLNDSNYPSTPYGSDFIPEYINTTGQKRFSSESSIPNLPKTENMFFVYFSLNPETQAMINKKRALISYLVGDSSSEKPTNVAEKNLASTIKSSLNKLKDNFLNSISPSLTKMSKNMSSSSEKSETGSSISTASNSKSFGDYIPDKFLLNQLSFELSKFVKQIDKPSINFEVKEYNEYNRKRLVYDKVNYSPISVTFYDVKENPVQQFLFAYLKIIHNDFLCKDYTHYNKKIVTNKFDHDINDWGFSIDSGFRLIDKISICEYYMNKMMVYTIENPVIESISFGSNKTGSYTPNEITVKFKYEGITNDLLDVQPYNVQWTADKSYLKSMINANITAEMATFLNVRYKSGTEMGVDTAVSFIKGILDAPKEERWEKIKSQSLDTLRKLGFADEVNTVNNLTKTVENFNNADDKGKYLLKMTDDPSSAVGEILGGGSTTSSTSLLKSFF